jgi:hypothetical protein
VTVAGEAGIGREIGGKGGKGGATRDVSVVGRAETEYAFDNPQDAQRFTEALAKDPAKALNDFSRFREGGAVEGRVEGTATVQVGEEQVEVKGGVAARHDFATGETTLSLQDSVEDKMVGKVDSKVGLVLDSHNNVVGATLEGTARANAASIEGYVKNLTGEGINVSGNANAGVQLHYEATLDTSDPSVQQDLAVLARNPTDSRAMADLVQRSDVKVDVDTFSSAERTFGADGKVVGTEIKTSIDQSWSKEANAPFISLP